MRLFLGPASLLVIVAIGCDGRTSVNGRVLNPDGEPIPGAMVRFTEHPDKPDERESKETTTDEEGRFSVSITHAPFKTPFLLEVSKEGFIRHQERLTGTASYDKEIVLQPAKK